MYVSAGLYTKITYNTGKIVAMALQLGVLIGEVGTRERRIFSGYPAAWKTGYLGRQDRSHPDFSHIRKQFYTLSKLSNTVSAMCLNSYKNSLLHISVDRYPAFF